MPPPFNEAFYRTPNKQRFVCRLCKQAQRIAGSRIVTWGTEPTQRMRICSACAKTHIDKDKP